MSINEASNHHHLDTKRPRPRLLRLVPEGRRCSPLLQGLVWHVAHHADADEDETWPWRPRAQGLAWMGNEKNGRVMAKKCQLQVFIVIQFLVESH